MPPRQDARDVTCSFSCAHCALSALPVNRITVSGDDFYIYQYSNLIRNLIEVSAQVDFTTKQVGKTADVIIVKFVCL